ncbi:serine/threonine-protein kinase [Aurantiacibacter flavus]|uniref:Serine/threonine-protein kinase n=1 Tax=Aurantiacibacter flavus TaxID=3145232 RepID=A0ABV0CUZ6_9SPHN
MSPADEYEPGLPTMPYAGPRLPAGGEALAPGTKIGGQYEIERELAHSATGYVYRAKEGLGSHSRPVALKVFALPGDGEGRLAERFLALGMANQQIRHPGLVAVRGLGKTEQGAPFMAMELVEGRDLGAFISDHLARGQEIALASLAAIVRGVGEVVAAGHAQGIAHGALRPARIILTDETPGGERIKLLGFGLSAREFLQEGELGARPYDAPETRAGPAQLSSDVFALSVLLYELLMGVTPQAPYCPPSQGRTDVPATLDALLAAGLSARPLSRPADAAEFLAQMEAALAGEEGGRSDPIADPGDPRNEPQSGDGRVTVKKGALFVRPHRDANGKWYMPDMVDEQGRVTKWSKLWGYNGAWFK